MAGVNAEEEEYKYLYGTRNDVRSRGIPRTEYGWHGQDLSNHTSRASAGYFSAVSIMTTKGIYLLELNGRYDGSSRFHTDQWAFFLCIHRLPLLRRSLLRPTETYCQQW